MRIDFHAHILPAMDHGCQGIGVSSRQLDMAADQEIDVVVATSHFYPHQENEKKYLERRREAWKELWHERQGLSPRILLGAEVLACRGMEKMECLKELCIEGTDILLLEMPLADRWEYGLIDTVKKIITDCNLKVVLAHAERYPLEEVEKLLKLGVVVQVNVRSMERRMRNRKQYVRAMKLVKRGCVVALGSDIHGEDNAYYIFSKVSRRYKRETNSIQEKTRELLASVLE